MVRVTGFMDGMILVKKWGLHIQLFIFLCSTFFIALVISWIVLVMVNFTYPLLYDYAGIGENIVVFAPKNTTKPHFDQSLRAEHIALFIDMVKAITHQGEGLAALTYHTQTGQAIPLLTVAELIHLQDVANLYDKMTWLAWAALLLWVGSVAIHYQYRVNIMSMSLLPYVFVPPIIVIVVLTIGAEKIFYKLHTLVFPSDHQWLFYYEESLMSMMMKAPDLFAYIAVMLALLALFFSVGILWFYRHFLVRREVT
jgi:hypothetical protein